ncbi:MAG TPA: hydrogen gas-evolving membrane-bound hydrogenase subunit E [Acidimicrobiia bacterium]|nr:hydrogen gas-evolving membrane-bound hydrogenase subunit E [Acidimicrobiia bacterium]
MILVLAVHALVAVAAVIWGGRLGRRVLLLGAVAPAAAFAWLLSTGGAPVAETFEWLPALGLDIDFRLDGFGVLMVGLVGGIGVLVFVYAWQYFGEREGLGRFTMYLVVFAGSMFGLVTADNLLLLFVFWELTSIASYLLIGFDDETAAARAGALQALLVTGAGGLAMLGGIVLLAQQAGSYSMAAILSDPPSSSLAGWGLALVLLGAFTKSAQFPFHFWLPGAMSAATPVSAFLHSATMVKAGIYVVARLAPVFAVTFGWWRPVLVAVGLVTMLVGGWRALAQHDMKLLLAQGTVSQLGLIMVLVGAGIPELTFAGMAMILAHAVFKAALFMVAGVVDHQAHTRDIRRLTGLGRALPVTAAIAMIATASMAGVPPLLGFVSKEAALEALVHEPSWWIATMGVVIGSALTAAYGLRFVWGSFWTKPQGTIEHPVGPDVPRPTVAFVGPPLLLVVVTVVAGLAPAIVDGLVVGASEAVDPAAGGYHLALWHGFGLPLALSGAALLGGWALWKRPLPRLRAVTSRAPDATRVYSSTVSGLTHTADRVTAFMQNGSLPVYLGVILLVTVVVPGTFLFRHGALPADLVFAESPLQTVAAALVIGASIGTVLAFRRLGAVLFLGAVGYGVAVLFVIQGAPDLALTQLLVETLTLALFILVLRLLPNRFEDVESRIRRFGRLGIAGGVGLLAGGYALWASSVPGVQSSAGEYLARSLPDGGGENVVNVILTDFRALDTLGEITVLAVVSLGAMVLIRARRPDGEEEAPEEVAAEQALEEEPS